MSLPTDLTLERLTVTTIFISPPPDTGYVLISDGSGGTYWGGVALSSQQSTLAGEVSTTLAEILSIATGNGVPALTSTIDANFSTLSSFITELSASTLNLANFSTYTGTISSIFIAEESTFNTRYNTTAIAFSSLSASFGSLSTSISPTLTGYGVAISSLSSSISSVTASTFSAAIIGASSIVSQYAVADADAQQTYSIAVGARFASESTAAHVYASTADQALFLTLSTQYLASSQSIAIASIATIQSQLSTSIGVRYLSTTRESHSSLSVALFSTVSTLNSSITSQFTENVLNPLNASITALSTRVNTIDAVLSLAISSITSTTIDVIGIYTQMAQNQIYLSTQIATNFINISTSFSSSFVSLTANQNVSGVKTFISTVSAVYANISYLNVTSTGISTASIDTIFTDRMSIGTASIATFSADTGKIGLLSAASANIEHATISSMNASILSVQNAFIQRLSANTATIGSLTTQQHQTSTIVGAYGFISTISTYNVKVTQNLFAGAITASSILTADITIDGLSTNNVATSTLTVQISMSAPVIAADFISIGTSASIMNGWVSTLSSNLAWLSSLSAQKEWVEYLSAPVIWASSLQIGSLGLTLATIDNLSGNVISASVGAFDNIFTNTLDITHLSATTISTGVAVGTLGDFANISAATISTGVAVGTLGDFVNISAATISTNTAVGTLGAFTNISVTTISTDTVVATLGAFVNISANTISTNALYASTIDAGQTFHRISVINVSAPTTIMSLNPLNSGSKVLWDVDSTVILPDWSPGLFYDIYIVSVTHKKMICSNTASVTMIGITHYQSSILSELSSSLSGIVLSSALVGSRLNCIAGPNEWVINVVGYNNTTRDPVLFPKQ